MYLQKSGLLDAIALPFVLSASTLESFLFPHTLKPSSKYPYRSRILAFDRNISCITLHALSSTCTRSILGYWWGQMFSGIYSIKWDWRIRRSSLRQDLIHKIHFSGRTSATRKHPSHHFHLSYRHRNQYSTMRWLHRRIWRNGCRAGIGRLSPVRPLAK